jgi:hypothetical protein
MYKLERVNWDKELVEELLVDVDEEAKKKNWVFAAESFWMDVNTAVKIFTNDHGNIGTAHGQRNVVSSTAEIGAYDAMEE